MNKIKAIFARHERVALQLSGGRDSLACLYLMRPYWKKLTVYWLNTGDAFPETIQIIDNVRKLVPKFVEINGDQPGSVSNFGFPTDLLPAANTPIGIMATGGQGVLMQERYSCCYRVLMAPLHQRMFDDGITLLIRGQRADDSLKAPITSGDVENGIECLLPIETWTAADVDAYLLKENAEVPRFYETMNASPDCMTCSAWWEENRAQYLKTHHPEKYALYQARLDVIQAEVGKSIVHFNREIL